MKELNQEKVQKVCLWLKKAIDVNNKTEKSVDVALTGNWNEVEVRVYENKEISAPNILYEIFSLEKETDYDEEQKMEAVDSFFNLTFKTFA